MIASLLSDDLIVFWIGILLTTTMLVSAAFVTTYVYYLSEKSRTFFLCIEIISALLILDILLSIATRWKKNKRKAHKPCQNQNY